MVTKIAAVFSFAGLLTIAVEAIGGTAAIPVPQAGAWEDKRPILTPASIEFGVYDPHNDFGTDPGVGIEHLFIPWEEADLASLSDADRYARARGRSLLLTVEPWSWLHPLSSEQLRAHITTNRYDDTIAAMCGAINDLTSPVTIRWAHEMEDTNGRFPWAGWDPEIFKAAYRKFVLSCRSHASQATFMWSPKGMEGLAPYYPGDDVVDTIGLSVFGLQDYDIDHFTRDRTFAEVLKPRYDRVVAFGKPIYVAELGYEGLSDYVQNWAGTVAVQDPSFPALQGVVYYNHKEIYPWPEEYGLPDWRVRREGGD